MYLCCLKVYTYIHNYVCVFICLYVSYYVAMYVYAHVYVCMHGYQSLEIMQFKTFLTRLAS